jgi:two-component system, cell cycle sensor histidine kinase and response regulator CckA
MPSKPIRVLIVEDTANDCELIVSELTHAGLDLEWQRVDREADYVAALQPDLDVVLSDFNVPGFGALRALELLRARALDVPFIVVSGSIGEETAVQILRCGAADYLLKDRLSRLGQAVQRVIDERRLYHEKQEAKQALIDAEQRMRFALDASRVGIWEVDFRTGRTRWSETLETLHGLAPGTFRGTFSAFLDRIHLADRDEVRETIAGSRAAQPESNIEYRTQWPDGSVHWIASKGRTFYDEAGAPKRAAGIGIDVTERRQLEEQYRQSQKMDAVGQLAGGVAHDFNNLLTVMHGYIELMFDTLGSQPPYADFLGELRQATTSATSLTRQLLAFSRRQILEPRVLDLGESVRAVEPILKRLIGAHITVAVQVAGSSRIKADPGQIEQIIMNLAVNARDAMPEGGRLSLTVEGLAETRQVVLTVSDTGHGIDRETQARIFEPFFTTKAQGRGTGLGLSTVYGIVQQSGGRISVESEPGHGAAFRISFPQVDDPIAAQEPPQVRSEARGSEAVLVVEDDPLVRELVRTVLERAGYQVTVAKTPTEALDFIRTEPREIHLLVTDVVLPEMNGRALAGRIIGERPDIRVLFMSGYIDHGLAENGVDAGVAFVVKPFTPHALVLKVREVLS